MVRLIIAALLLVSSFLIYIGNQSADRSVIIGQFEAYLNQQYVHDSLVIRQYLNSDDDRLILNQLNDSPFLIEINKNDSIIYWTDLTDINEIAPKQIHPISQIGDTMVYATVRLNLSGLNGYIQPILLEKAGITEKLKTIGSSGEAKNIHIDRSSNISIYIDDQHNKAIFKAIAWLFLFIAMVIFTVNQIQNFNQLVAQNKNWKHPFLIILVTTFIFRLLHFSSTFSDLFRGFTGFLALNHTSILNKSLCDFLLNLWIFGLAVYILNILSTKKISYSSPKKITFASGFFTFLLFGTCVHFIEGFVVSSQVNLEIESLLTFNIISFGLIICFIIMMILIFQCTQLMYEMVHASKTNNAVKYTFLSLGWTSSLIILWMFGWLNVPIWIFIVFVIAYSLILDAYVENKAKKITYLIWWLIMFSGFLAVSLFYFGLKKDVAARTEFLHKYYIEPNGSVIHALEVLADSLANSGIFSKLGSLENPARLDMNDLDQYIFNNTTLGLKSLERSIELFDKKGNTQFSNHFANYYKTDQSFKNARRISKNIYHNPFEDKYILRFEIDKSVAGNTSSYLFIIHQNTDIARNKYLEENSTNFGYAVFNQNRLIEKNEVLQAMPDIAIMNALDTTQIKNGYSFVVSRPSAQFKIVSYKKVSGLIKPISLFLFIFTLCGLIILILSFINTTYDFLPENISLKFGSRSSLKTKIQLSIILLILVTFLVIGAITAYYFKNLIEVNQFNKNKEETTSIINNINSDIQNMVDDDGAVTFLNTKLKEFSLVHNKELSLFDNEGRLLGSSMKGINQIRIPFSVWNNATATDKNYGLGQLNGYDPAKTTFLPIVLTEKRPLAYIGVAHKSYNNSSKSILDFLSTILNAYIFLFLIAGAIAITIANSITQPLSILAEKLKKFKLGKTNELLEWKSNDEIGTLIHDYNNLTQELERSAGVIAKTERDLAWREMAKQVAHEIKNPLTPMKLSIQYLDRTAKEYPDKAQDLIPRISSTLIEQIDNLTQIANEFSNFATMPQATNEKLILNEIVEAVHDLFRKRDDMDINMIEPIDDLYVFADKNHLVRILNNLLKNAIQAIPETRRGRIDIELKRQGNNAIIRVTDNGSGIPDHMKDKVFTPNFTTKSSGTGLGLAISANMIESFNGKIYFDTRVGSGTDFYVSIPLMRLDDYLGDDGNRVSLD
ncbi:MAG: HAMP domain-containing histidine kinase [Saprospiraceae bacterium]|nr:HAMP domain-containing histidine kinase [Saprospiraceae bacterium]